MFRKLFYKWWSRKKLRVLICHEYGWVVAQCLEYDVCAQGKTVHDALTHLTLALVELERDSLQQHGQAFAHTKPAPEKFHAMWNNGTAKVYPRQQGKDDACVDDFTLDCATV